MKVTTLPPKLKRKTRKQEAKAFCVTWIDGSTLYHSFFARDNAACDFTQQLVEQGFQPKLTMK